MLIYKEKSPKTGSLSVNSFSVSRKKLLLFSLIWLVLPINIFFLTWLRLVWGIVFSVLLDTAVGFAIRTETGYIDIKKTDLLITGIIIVLILFFSGMGGMFVQTWDNNTKNAIIRDLIEFDWPIVYRDTGYMLVYYVVFWLVPALTGKILGWQAANCVIFIWSFIGIFMVLIWSYSFVSRKCKIKLWHIAGMFFLWSGLNCLGEYFVNTVNCLPELSGNSGEGWLDGSIGGQYCGYLYRSTFDCLQQVYNQAIVVWLVTSIFLNTDRIEIFALLGITIFPYSPIAFIGILPFFIVKAISIIVNEKASLTGIGRQIFSRSNVLSIISILVFCFYFSCNSNSSMSLYVSLDRWNIKWTIALLLFYVFEFGLWVVFLFRSSKSDCIFWVTVISLLVIPFFEVGHGRDFCMNAAIAPVFIVCLLYSGNLFSYFREKNSDVFFRVKKLLMICIFALGTVTPLSTCISESVSALNTDEIEHYADNTYTLSDKRIGDSIKDTWVEFYLVPKDVDVVFTKYFMKKGENN